MSSTDLPAPTTSDNEWAEWQVGSYTVSTGQPVCIHVEIGGQPTELPIPSPRDLAAALLAADRGEWEQPATA